MERAVPYILVGLLALALFVVLGFLAARGLGELGGGSGTEGWQHDGHDEAWAGESTNPAFVYVEPLEDVASAPQPPWASFPRSAIELTGEPRSLSVARLRGHLAIGDELTRHALLSALRSLRADGAPDESIVALFAPIVEGHPTSAHCRWLRSTIVTEPDVPIREAFFAALAACRDPQAIAVFVGGRDVPATAAAAFARAHPWLFAEPRASVEAMVASPDVDLRALLAVTTDAHERERLARALVRCATEEPATSPQGEWRSAQCLDALHSASPAMALPAARAIDARGPPLSYLHTMAHQIAEELTGDQLAHRLRDRGLLREGDEPDPDAPAAVAARDVLALHGRAICFETTNEVFPVGHEGLLVRLAWLARPDLADVSFEETPPYAGDHGYRLHAYADGYVQTVDARSDDGRYDTYAVLGLLNALLRDRYVDTRLAWLEAPELDVECVVAGSQQGLLEAEREGLITLAEAAD